MPETVKHITLPKKVESGDDLDFSFLREKGLEYIEQLAGALWTDYNSHDPGITILEMLAYAITDLASRVELPMEHLLTPGGSEAAGIREQFFTALQVLPSHPVTGTDYRKLFIDIEGVKNCWLLPYRKAVQVDHKNSRLSYNPADFKDIDASLRSEFHLKGLYTVVVDLDNLDPETFPEESAINTEKERIFNEIRRRYHAHRNLGEDLVDIAEVETHPIAICARIELYPEANEELAHARVLRAIDDYFSPSLQFYSMKEMIERGYTTDRIIDGPVLEHGFIDPEELEQASLRSEVRLSDIIHRIMNIEGVKVINDITIKDCSSPNDESDRWIIPITRGRKPARCRESAYSYYKGVLPVNINQQEVSRHLDEIAENEKSAREQARFDREPAIPKGEYLEIGATTTIQNDFPDNYGIGREGLPPHTDPARKAKARQLQGYLLFFDQVLASYFVHLEKVKELLSVNRTGKGSYFTQAVKEIKGFTELVNGYPEEDDKALTELLFSGLDNRVERDNKILDHLIARFAERFSEYAFLMKQLYGSRADEMVLHTKQAFLADYDQTGMRRGSAFNYFYQPEENLWNSENVSGVEKRISRLTGVKDIRRRNLSEGPVELYTFDDSEGRTVFRWRIRNESKKILLTATENYPSVRLAEEELAKSVLKVIETPVEVIEEVFASTPIVDETIVGNLQVQRSQTGRYSFNVINRAANPNSTKWVIARHYIYYGSTATLKRAMVELVEFMTYRFSEEGLFLVEHILLRPDVTAESVPLQQFMPIRGSDTGTCSPVDPYSFRVTVILPGWTYRFANSDFREFMENKIREELPAHILARICWIGYRENHPTTNENDMARFEEIFRDYLFSKTSLGQAQDEEQLIRLTGIMSRLNSIYPSGRLLDCGDEEEDIKGRIILGRTHLGNI